MVYIFQVLAKASKIIPVMIMGKVVSHTTYEYYEYVTAVLISIGMTLFMLNSSDYKGGECFLSFTVNLLIFFFSNYCFNAFRWSYNYIWYYSLRRLFIIR